MLASLNVKLTAGNLIAIRCYNCLSLNMQYSKYRFLLVEAQSTRKRWAQNYTEENIVLRTQVQ